MGKKPGQTRKIGVVNHKGGVGKTTTCLNVAAGLRKLRKKVLLIDLDPQAHLTYSMGIEPDHLQHTVYELLAGNASFHEVVRKKEGLSLLPSNVHLAAAEHRLQPIAGCEYLLAQRLNQVDAFDFIIIDCPPSLGLLTINAFTFAGELIIPIQTEFFALQGVRKLLATIKQIKDKMNEHLRICGVLATRYNRRIRLNREVMDSMKDFFGALVFSTPVRENISLAEAPSFHKSIFAYKPSSHGAQDYLQVCREIVKR